MASPLALIAPGLTAAAASVVDRAMQWEPSSRYPDAASMRAAVLAACTTLGQSPYLRLDTPFEAFCGDDDRPTQPDTPRAQRAPDLGASGEHARP